MPSLAPHAKWPKTVPHPRIRAAKGNNKRPSARRSRGSTPTPQPFCCRRCHRRREHTARTCRQLTASSPSSALSPALMGGETAVQSPWTLHHAVAAITAAAAATATAESRRYHRGDTADAVCTRPPKPRRRRRMTGAKRRSRAGEHHAQEGVVVVDFCRDVEET